MEWYRQERTKYLTTPAVYGNARGRKTDGGGRKSTEGKRLPGRQYNKDSYRIAIKRAAESVGVTHWYSSPLRVSMERSDIFKLWDSKMMTAHDVNRTPKE